MKTYKVSVGAAVFLSENIHGNNQEEAQQKIEAIANPEWFRKVMNWQEPFVSSIISVHVDKEPDSTPPEVRKLHCPSCNSVNVEMTDHESLEIGMNGRQFDPELYGRFFCNDCNEDFKHTLRVCI